MKDQVLEYKFQFYPSSLLLRYFKQIIDFYNQSVLAWRKSKFFNVELDSVSFETVIVAL